MDISFASCTIKAARLDAAALDAGTLRFCATCAGALSWTRLASVPHRYAGAMAGLRRIRLVVIIAAWKARTLSVRVSQLGAFRGGNNIIGGSDVIPVQGHGRLKRNRLHRRFAA